MLTTTPKASARERAEQVAMSAFEDYVSNLLVCMATREVKPLAAYRLILEALDLYEQDVLAAEEVYGWWS